LSVLGLVYNDTNRPQEAVKCHEEAVTIARQLKDQKGLALRLGQLANALLGMGEPQRALAAYQESVDRYRALGDTGALAVQLSIMANLNAKLGRNTRDPQAQEAYFVQALAHYRETLRIAREQGDTVGEAVQLRGMGAVYGNLGDYDAALRHFKEALRLFAAIEMVEQVARLEESIQLAEKLRDGS
jgi:tetratricopeptide (TPR) repeat protein